MKFIVCIISAVILLSGCALYQAKTDLQGSVLSSIAKTDESARAKCQEVAPQLLKAWPYFSGFYKGLKGKEGWKATLSQQNQELWEEVDKIAADYTKSGTISDYDCGYFITSKFLRLMPAIYGDLITNYANIPIVAQVLSNYQFLLQAGVFG